MIGASPYSQEMIKLYMGCTKALKGFYFFKKLADEEGANLATHPEYLAIIEDLCYRENEIKPQDFAHYICSMLFGGGMTIEGPIKDVFDKSEENDIYMRKLRVTMRKIKEEL